MESSVFMKDLEREQGGEFISNLVAPIACLHFDVNIPEMFVEKELIVFVQACFAN